MQIFIRLELEKVSILQDLCEHIFLETVQVH